MRKLFTLFVLLAVAAGLAALGLWMVRGQTEVPELPSAPLLEAPRPSAGPSALDTRPPQGGIFQGRVEDQDGTPIPGAQVLLVAYQAGDPDEIEAYKRQLSSGEGMPDPTMIPTVGGHELAGEKVADAEGRFRIAADRAAYISHVIAYQMGYFPDVVLVSGTRPNAEGEHKGIVVQLRRAGRVLGHVVDDETDDPVPGARVDITLQQRTRPPPEMNEDGSSAARSADGEGFALSPMVMLGRFLYEVLGERVWGIEQQSLDALVLRTDENGRFELGPLADTVQLEFVVTHPEYIWIDFDNPDGKSPPRRSVVEPGETIKKELRLRRGGEIEGRVIDEETGEAFPDAAVAVESISAYWMHWWYRSKKRHTRTDSNGHFRVAGLSIGDQSIQVRHPSFGLIYKPGVAPGTKDVVIYVERFAGLRGTVTGLSSRPQNGRIEVAMHRLREDGSDESFDKRMAGLDQAGRFQLSKIKPGRYRIWIRAGTETSQPLIVELNALGTANEVFALGGGGEIRVPLRDEAGDFVVGAAAQLIQLDGEHERALGQIVSREGKLEADSMVPGRYVLEIRAQGYLPMRSDPFEVEEGRVAVPTVKPLLRYAKLSFGPILDERGRILGSNRGTVVVEMRRGDGPARRLMGLSAQAMSLAPGPVTITCRVEQAGLAYEETHELKGGELTTIAIRLKSVRR